MVGQFVRFAVHDQLHARRMPRKVNPEDDELQVFARKGELDSDIAADCTGADDGDLHVEPSMGHSNRLRSFPMRPIFTSTMLPGFIEPTLTDDLSHTIHVARIMGHIVLNHAPSFCTANTTSS
jgi:hypothetical protein